MYPRAVSKSVRASGDDVVMGISPASGAAAGAACAAEGLPLVAVPAAGVVAAGVPSFFLLHETTSAGAASAHTQDRARRMGASSVRWVAGLSLPDGGCAPCVSASGLRQQTRGQAAIYRERAESSPERWALRPGFTQRRVGERVPAAVGRR